MEAVRIGINPITWTNDDDPRLGGETPLETCLSEAREAGYAGVEMGGKFPREARAMCAALAPYGLALVSGWYSGGIAQRSVEEEWQAISPHLQLLKTMGCRVVVYADTSYGRNGAAFRDPISRRPVLPGGDWAAYGAKLTQLAERMVNFGVQMAFHHHMGTIVETDAEVDALMRYTGPAVGLLLDTGHSIFAGGDPKKLVRRHLQRIVHVHCKDYRPAVLARAKKEDMTFMRAVVEGIFTVPGDGATDYADILGVLAQGGYSGWLVVEAEQDPARAHPLTYAKLGYDNLSRLARTAGFTLENSHAAD